MTIGSATVTTTYEYAVELGHRYAFRVRATDQVSNTGEWVEATTVRSVLLSFPSEGIMSSSPANTGTP
jgi:hypothetical protein